MKLSDFSTERAVDVLCELVPYVNSITLDEELLGTLKKKLNPGGESLNKAAMLTLGAQRLAEIVPIIFKKHKEDVFGILAALNGKTAEEIAKQNIIKTMLMIREAVKDEELVAFFTSCAERDESA